MEGTALHVRRFLLVEHPGPWAFDALGSSGIAPPVLEQIVAATSAIGGRTLLIRRHGRVASGDERAWGVADVDAGTIRWGRWRDDADLLEARDALHEPGAGWSTEPTLLVCTHGRHDTCCAVRGRPVAAALVQRHGDRVWEASHVGGDRFAPSVVVLPDGTFYGGLDEGVAPDVIDRHLAGTVDVEHLRGTSMFDPVSQAAAVAVHRRYGPGGPRDVVSASVQTIEHGRWRVELRCTGPLPPRVVADVEAHHAEAAMLTCQARAAARARTFAVTELRASGAS
jgi:hypothetical protein